MLYIDSPAGTGLSYSTDPADYTTDDFQATQDAYHALLSWFQTYPLFQSHDFYITGESYAGVTCALPLLRTEQMQNAAVLSMQRHVCSADASQ